MNTQCTANPLEIGADDLERFALEECVKRQRFDHRVSVLIVEDPRGECAIKFARLGASVVVADTRDKGREITGRVLAAGVKDEITVERCTLKDLPQTLTGEPFDIIVLRDGLSDFPYAEAQVIVRAFLRRLRIGGKLYISVFGLHSELSEQYDDRDKPIGHRFAPLAAPIAAKYGIDHRVCLYSERDFFLLLLESGASVLRTLTTTYGNVKGVAVRV